MTKTTFVNIYKENHEKVVVLLNKEELNLTKFAEKHNLDRLRLGKIRSSRILANVDELSKLMEIFELFI